MVNNKKIAIAVAIVITVMSALSITSAGRDEVEAAAVLATFRKPLPGGGSGGGSDSDYLGLYYNDSHRKADKIDLTMLPAAELLEIPEELYAGKVNLALDKVDLEGEIRTYKLICEILSEEAINPSDSDVGIRPYHIYGSWFGEIRYSKKPGAIGFDPNVDKVVNPGNGQYLGPFSMDKSYYTSTETSQLMPRMYAYISSSENPDVKDNERAIRISKYELSGSIINDAWVGINNATLDLEPVFKEEYITTFKQNLKFDPEDRPNPEYVPDAIYTYCKKLRTNYQGKNNYTLNTDGVIRWDDFDKTYEKFVTKGGDYKSDLYFLGSVYKNSSELKPHQYSFEAGYPSAENDFINAMPYLYMEMIEQYGSLDINEIGLFNGWREQHGSEQKFFGTKFVSPMYTAEIVSPDNLISRLDSANTEVINQGKVRELMTGVHKYACDKNGGESELEWSLYYPLRCITNGKMIQAGVEEMIDQVYDIQVSTGVIKTDRPTGGGGDGDEGEGSDGDEDWDDGVVDGEVGSMSDDDIYNKGELVRKSRLTPEEKPSGRIKIGSDLESISRDNIIFPILLKSTDKYRVSHGYWCGATDSDYSYYGCAKYHSAYGQHYAVDFNYRRYNPDHEKTSDADEFLPSSSDIVAFADGVVVAKTDTHAAYGVRIILKHEYDGVEYYTHYAHMKTGSTKYLSIGDSVSAGQKIGYIGSTGNSTGIHLHFAVYTGTIDERNSKSTAYDIMLLTGKMQKVR